MHVFTAFIFPSEQCEEIISSLHYYFAAFYYFGFYHLFTTATHYKVCIMQWQCNGLYSVLLYGFDPERLQSHLWRGTCTVQFALVCGNGQ